ncbi:MAG: efflux transporter outer membrane subunit [Alphaproteobacteria bacterium]|nr:efflux transporter outer membrane subunit [Alphaproteobacteria bacterium]
MMHKPLPFLLLAATALSGCSLVPDFSRPDFSAAQSWNDIPAYELPKGEQLAAKMDWKEFFNSEDLWLVIGTALQNNKDLKTAALNIDEARALYRIERADLMPNVNANGSGQISKSSDESSVTGHASKSELYDANLGIAAYEVDLFGRIRSNNESAINEYLATQEAHAVVRNALIAETANAYLQLLADQKLLSLTSKTLEAQKRTYDILSESLKKGVSTEQDVARAATAVETARVNLHQYSRYVAQDKNALFLLMGIPQDNTFLPKASLDKVKLKEGIDPGLPSEVLLMRPDIRQAEYELVARNADIGAARAAFFPSISLTGTYGFASQSLSNLFASGAGGAWAFLPQITLPIFQGGRNEANLDLAKIRKEKAVVNYEKAIQTAFREVSDELAARATLDKQLQAQQRLVGAAQKVYDISQARYKSGIDSFLSVLDSQRELYTYQQNEIQIERQRLSNLVNLYKVLGGGTVVEE